MKKNFIIFFVSFFFLFLLSNNSQADNSDPEKFIQEIVDKTKKILVASNSQSFKEEKLTEIAKEKVDIKGVGLYTLGKYRKKLSDKQNKEYSILFEQYFLKTFVSRLTDYSEPKIEVVSSEKKNDKYTIVSSILLATEKKPEVKIDWRVYTKDPDNTLIRDLIVEGLSLARTQKEEFASVLESNNGDINKLFATLKEFINK